MTAVWKFGPSTSARTPETMEGLSPGQAGGVRSDGQRWRALRRWGIMRFYRQPGARPGASNPLCSIHGAFDWAVPAVIETLEPLLNAGQDDRRGVVKAFARTGRHSQLTAHSPSMPLGISWQCSCAGSSCCHRGQNSNLLTRCGAIPAHQDLHGNASRTAQRQTPVILRQYQARQSYDHRRHVPQPGTPMPRRRTAVRAPVA